jgi:hypothetical protein
MEIHSLNEVSDEILDKLTILMNKDCQPGKFTLKELSQRTNNCDILYLLEQGEPVYFLLLDKFLKHKTVYIHDVCVSKSQRGQGIFKKSIAFLKVYYSQKGFTSFTLDASDSTKEEGLDQKARIKIFHSAGFHINPETGFYKSNGDYEIIKTIVSLNSGTKDEIQGRDGDTYLGKNNNKITIDQIVHCYDSDTNQISCPMRMEIPKAGGTRKVYYPKKYYRGLSQTRKTERLKEIKKFGSRSWRDTKAYLGFKTDRGVKTKKSGYTANWNRKFPNAKSLEDRAKVTGVPLKYIRASYNRGMAAWRTGHRPGATQQQWGYARVSSFLLKGKTYHTTDADLAREAKKASAAARKWWS